MPLVAWLFQLTKNFAFLDLVNSFSLLSHWLEVPCHLINNKVFLFFCLKFSRYNRRFFEPSKLNINLSECASTCRTNKFPRSCTP